MDFSTGCNTSDRRKYISVPTTWSGKMLGAAKINMNNRLDKDGAKMEYFWCDNDINMDKVPTGKLFFKPEKSLFS